MRTRRFIGVFLYLTCGLASVWGFGVTTGERIKTEGLVVSRQHDSVTMKTADQSEVVVLVTGYTKIFIPHGFFTKKTMPPSSLVQGLWIKVEGVENSPGHVLAAQISFSDNDLRTAKAIQGGLTPLNAKVEAHEQQIQTNQSNIQANQQQLQVSQQQIQDNRQNIRTNQVQVQQLNQRFVDLTDYEVKPTSFVYFPIGRSDLSMRARGELLQLASNARRQKGYLIQVEGYTDSAGRAATNQDLSMRRAQSVIAFLEQNGNIPLTHVLTPGAMGETAPAVSNESSQGRAENRRAEIKVIINRGLSGE